MTSRMDGASVSSMHRRSKPMPMPPVGGRPYSSALMKSSSKTTCMRQTALLASIPRLHQSLCRQRTARSGMLMLRRQNSGALPIAKANLPGVLAGTCSRAAGRQLAYNHLQAYTARTQSLEQESKLHTENSLPPRNSPRQAGAGITHSAEGLQWQPNEGVSSPHMLHLPQPARQVRVLTQERRC